MFLRDYHPVFFLSGVCAVFLGGWACAQEADLLLPEEFHVPEPLRLSAEHERRAECASRYMEALFEEESRGPDQALSIKKRVLDLDPGFTDLSMDVARQYLRIGEISEAISVLKDAAKASPKKSEPLVALSGIYLRQLQKPDLAEKYANQAVLATPDDSIPYQMLHEIYRTTSQPQKMETLFTRIAKRPSRSADFWLDLAELRLRDSRRETGETSRIVEMLESAQNFAGDRAEILARIGNAFLLCGLPGRAIPLYQLALVLQPDMEGIREKLAVFLIQTGEIPEAINVLEALVKKDPLNFRAYDQLTELYVQTNEIPKAVASLGQSVLVAPADPRRYTNLIQLSLRAGDADSAVLHAEEAGKVFPRLLEFAFFKALALTESGRYEEAVRLFESVEVEAAISRPEILNSDFYFSYGRSAEQAGRLAKAEEALRKSIERDPANSARACNYLGYLWAERGENLEEAETLIRSAVDSEPDNGAYLDSLGWVYFKKGLHEQAFKALTRAVELLKTEDAIVLDHLGDVCEKLGKFSEAVCHWQRALLLEPKNATIAAKLDARASEIARKPDAPAKPGSLP